MPHIETCQTRRTGGIEQILLSALDENGIRIHVAEALQRRERGAAHQYFCPDNECRAEMVPRRAAHNIPLRHADQTGVVREGFYERRAHYACLPESTVLGPRIQRVSQRQEAIDLIASHLRASGLYDINSEGNPAVYTNLRIGVEINRKEYTRTQPSGWGELGRYPADIIALRNNQLFIIQVEDQPIASRYGSSNEFIKRVRRLAGRKADKRKTLYAGNRFIGEMPRQVYQTTVVLKGPYYYSEDRDNLTPTETVLLAGLFDTLNVLDMETERLTVVNLRQTQNTLRDLQEFGFIEAVYGPRYHKRFHRSKANRGTSVLIPELSVAKPVPIIYNPQTGIPVNQDTQGQQYLF